MKRETESQMETRVGERIEVEDNRRERGRRKEEGRRGRERKRERKRGQGIICLLAVYGV